MSQEEELDARIDDIWSKVQALGADPFPVEFFLVPDEALYEIAAYGTVNHWNHWSYGRDYWLTKERLERGHGRLYEVVLNANPALAYLLRSNEFAQNLLVIAHVAGHSHFFKHNAYFASTRRDMPTWFGLMAQRMRGYEDNYGFERVEKTLDYAMSIREQWAEPVEEDTAEFVPLPYAELFRKPEKVKKLPIRPWKLPTADLLGFIAEYAPFLEEWQRDIVRAVRSESKYFDPQRKTKILNEGFATWVHHYLMDDLVTNLHDGIVMGLLHANVVAKDLTAFNPYWFGWKLLMCIERDQGRDAVLDLVQYESDSSFVRNWLTKAYVEELELFIYTWEESKKAQSDQGTVEDAVHQIRDWQYIRDELANSLSITPPVIWIENVRDNYHMELRYRDVQALDTDWAQATLHAIHGLWGAPVSLRLADKTVLTVGTAEEGSK